MKAITGALQHGSPLACEVCHSGAIYRDGQRGVEKGRWLYTLEDDATLESIHADRLTMAEYIAGVDALHSATSVTAHKRIGSQLGWRFASALTELPYWNMIDGCTEDLMHRFLQGVVADLIEYTFGNPLRKKKTREPPRFEELVLPVPVAEWICKELVSNLFPQLPSEHHAGMRSPLQSWRDYSGS